LDKTHDLGKITKIMRDGLEFDVDFPENGKMEQLLIDIWHNQATEIKWLSKIHEELKKANSK